MELPKNITQIGESDRNCKIYVEDYVVSFIKQMNQLAGSKEIGVALYGVRKQEGTVTYLFIYGGAKLNFLHREVRHLSQAQCQEIEKLRKRYFEEKEFLGYCLLNGEMVEGFHVCEQEICRYVAGYAQFYEKNDSMLAYMLDTREEESEPEQVDNEKYDAVKQRQEERRAESGQYASRGGGYRAALRGEDRTEKPRERKEEQEEAYSNIIPMPSRSMKGMRVATIAIFGLLCLVAVSSFENGDGSAGIEEAARQVMSSLTEQKLPDAEYGAKEGEVTEAVQSDTLIAEDKLTEVLQQENIVSELTITPMPVAEATASPVPTSEPTPIPSAVPTPVPTPISTPISTAVPTPEPVSYIIKEGDTLIGICYRTYGSDARVSELCSLNNIGDPDDIKVGQKILLP